MNAGPYDRSEPVTPQSFEDMLKAGGTDKFKEALSREVLSNMSTQDADRFLRQLAILNEADRKGNSSIPALELFGTKDHPEHGVTGIELTIPGIGTRAGKTEVLNGHPDQDSTHLDPRSASLKDFRLGHTPTAREMADMLKKGEIDKFEAVFHMEIERNMPADQAEQMMRDIATLNREDRNQNLGLPELELTGSEGYKDGYSSIHLSLKRSPRDAKVPLL